MKPRFRRGDGFRGGLRDDDALAGSQDEGLKGAGSSGSSGVQPENRRV